MKAISKTLLCLILVVSASAPVLAQSARGKANRQPRQRAATNGQSQPATFDERRAQYVALLQVKKGLETYLATISPSSAEHRTMTASLEDTNAKIAALEKSLLEMIASPSQGTPRMTTPPGAPQPPPTVTRQRPAERAATTEGDETASGESTNSGDSTAATDTGASADTSASAQDEEETPAPQADDAAAAATPTPDVTFVEWLNDKVEEKSVALVNQGSPLNQTETPAGSDASTSLVDQSSATDLVSAAFNLAGLSGSTGDDKDVNSASVTTSAYALYSAFKGADPLDPEFYNRHSGWRKLSFTLGFDNEKKEGEETADKVTLAGFKFLLMDGREISKADKTDPEKCRVNQFMLNTTLGRADAGPPSRVDECDDRRLLTEAASEFGQLEEEVINYLFTIPTVRDKIIAPAYFKFVEEQLIPNLQRDLQRLRTRLARLTPDDRLSDAALQAEIDSLRRGGADPERTGPQDARLKRLLDVVELKAAVKTKQGQINEATANKALAASAVLNPARRNDWNFAEKQYARFGFKRIVLQNAGDFSGLLARLSVDEREAIEKLIDARINPFVKLNTSTRRALERIRARPQLSFSFLSKRRDRGDDEYTSDLIYERGLGTRTFATLNAGFKYKDSKLVGGDTRGGTVAGQLQFQVTPEESLISKSPIFLYVSGDAEWLSGAKPKYRAQAKVKIPLADGVEIPFSLTVANRTDLIDETDVRGQFGFTLDTAKLLRVFKFKLPSPGSALDLSNLVPPPTANNGQ